MEQARYHQPRWMNAIVIVWCSLVIAGWALLPKQDAQILAFVGVPAMLMFVAIVNKVRAGAFARVGMNSGRSRRRNSAADSSNSLSRCS
jgi:multisubunit Na+/H+ antiporter MnhG subunit